MTLCDICKSMPSKNLPRFAEDRYIKTLTGLQHVHTLVINRQSCEEEEEPRIKYHRDVSSLRRAAAAGCGLCRLIEGQADAILAEIDGLDDAQRELDGALPNFDMWLTKRPDGGEGFWVLSECEGESETPVALPIAAIAFVASEGDPLAKIFRGRPVKEDPDSQVLKQIAGWIADCNATHSCCPSKATLPRRLIDVGSSKFESLVRLVDLNEGIEGHYTALSYSRERGIRGDLARSTISPGRSSSIDVATLPKVYHDAMSVTRNLGIRYLWIDALCIPSDDLGEYVRESSKFAAVYTSAYLTIAATGARDDSEGLFFQRTSRSLVRLAHEGPQNTTGTLLMHLLPLNKEVHRAPYVEMKSEPLLNGVWAFQERVLAPRTIHFASDQIYFECMTHFVSEDGLLLNHRTHPTAKKLPPRGDRSRALSRWFQTLWDYGDCDPVKASDKLPAMGNIARAFQGILEDEYVAGLWKKSLIEGLCWQSLKCKPVNEYRAPSWSWASVDGTTGAGFHALRWEPLAIVQDMHVELEGSHPFGRIRAAWIRLEAPLAPLTLSEPKGPTGHIFLRTESSSDDGFYAGLDTINDVCDESREMLRDMNLFALLLAETRGLDGFPGGCGSGSCYHGIIVTPGDGPEESMKRIGFFVADPENFGPANIQSWKQVITLV